LAQLFSTNAFSAKTFCLNVLSTSTAIYSQYIGNTNNFSTDFYQRKQKYLENGIAFDKIRPVVWE